MSEKLEISDKSLSKNPTNTPATAFSSGENRSTWLHLNVQLRRWLVEILEQRRTQPAFHAFIRPAVDVAAAFLPHPLQHDLGVGEITSRENGDEPFGSVRDVYRRHVDDRVGTTHERLFHEADVAVIEDPHAFPLVGLDDEDAVLHGDFLPIWSESLHSLTFPIKGCAVPMFVDAC